jgi:hypothetical protein
VVEDDACRSAWRTHRKAALWAADECGKGRSVHEQHQLAAHRTGLPDAMRFRDIG